MSEQIAIWIDTASGTYGLLSSLEGRLVVAVVDSAKLLELEDLSGSQVAAFGEANAIEWEIDGDGFASLRVPLEVFEN